jgi:diguanylate cyclase (GGDEF)-like protein/PAS domain S-box-containing protein
MSEPCADGGVPDHLCTVLHVTGDEQCHLETRALLASSRFELLWGQDDASALALMRKRRHDAYLLDCRASGADRLGLLRDAFGSGLLAPVVVLADDEDYETELGAARLGIAAFVAEQELDAVSLERAIRYAIEFHRTVRELADDEQRCALAAEAAGDGIWDWDLLEGRIFLSPRWYGLLGRTDPGARRDPAAWFELVHGDDLPVLRAAIDAHLAGQTPRLEVEHRILGADGGWRWVSVRGLALRGEDGVPLRMAGWLSDITDRRATELRLRHDALHDALTGLPNRALFMDRASHLAQRAQRDPGLGCAVLFLDVDRFKTVNDSLSHAVGDQLLRALAGRLQSTLRPDDTVARIGGDEFTILLDGVAAPEQAELVAARIQRAISRPFRIDSRALQITASIGIALSSPGMTAAELVANADIAMYDAKRRGRGRSAVFEEGMRRRAADLLAREDELRQLVEQGLLPVSYQPIVDLADGHIHGFEALARWPGHAPDVAPLDFIPIAEESGLIDQLGLHVLRTSLEALAGWRQAGLVSEGASMNVNISPRQLEDPGFARRVRSVVAAAGLPAQALRLEISERALMKVPERIEAIADEMTASGVVLALDDFGTGYSSLAALNRFPVDALKIDRSFVSAINGDGHGGETIVRSTIALGNSLGVQVIAEGIERPTQLRRLRQLGCGLGQGFVFSRPMGEGAIESLLSGWTPAAVVALGQ